MRNHWLAYHIYLPFELREEFTPALGRVLLAMQERLLIHRFFHINYGEGGYHVRVRLQVQTVIQRDIVQASFPQAIVELCKTTSRLLEADITCLQNTYERDIHYFGETLESVYSELLNEQTSLLAIAIMHASPGQNRHKEAMLVLLSIWTLAATVEISASELIQQGLAFVQRNTLQVGGPQKAARRSDGRGHDPRRYVLRGYGNILKHLGAIAQRALQVSGRRHVVTHAVHLLMNKLNYTLHDEGTFYAVGANLLLSHQPSVTGNDVVFVIQEADRCL